MTRRAEGDDDGPDPSPSPVMGAVDAYRARFGPQALPHETVQNPGVGGFPLHLARSRCNVKRSRPRPR